MDEFELSKKKGEIFDNMSNNEKSGKGNNVTTAEETLSNIAIWIFYIGVIISIIFTLVGFSKISEYEKEEGYSLLIMVAWILPSSIILRAVLTVICNISSTLHEINKKLK